MKVIVFMTLLLMNATFVIADAIVLNPEMIEVDGFIRDEKPQDQELTTIQTEIVRQKKEIILNREKSKQFKVLSKSVEKLSETTVEYLEEKKAAQAEIAEYNMKVKCLQSESEAPECAKYNRRR